MAARTESVSVSNDVRRGAKHTPHPDARRRTWRLSWVCREARMPHGQGAGHREQQVILAKPAFPDMHFELGDDLRAELEPPVLLVLGVVLDEEPAALRVEPRGQLDDHPAHRQDTRAEVDVARTQLGQLAPPQAALDVRLRKKLHVRRQRQVELVELLRRDDGPRLLRNWRGLPSADWMQVDDVVKSSCENSPEDRLAVPDDV